MPATAQPSHNTNNKIEDTSPAQCPPLVDLRFLDQGRQWPPPSQQPRFKRYEKNILLWDGDHDQVFGNWWRVLREDQAASLELVFNWHKRLSCLWADLMLSEPPRFTDGADEDDPTEEDPADAEKPKPGEEGFAHDSDEDRDAQAEKEAKEEVEKEQTPNPFSNIPEDKPAAGEVEARKKQKKKKNNPRQDALDRLIGKDENGYVNTLYKVALDISRFGNGLTKINLAKEGAEIWAQPPTYWYPVTFPHNLQKVKNHVLAWEFEAFDPSGATDNTTPNRYLWVEIHHKGLIEYRVHQLSGDTIGPRVPIKNFDPDQADQEKTNLDDEFLVVPFATLATSDRFFGHDDYKDLDSILAAIEVRAAMINKVLDLHTDPAIYGPPDQLRRNPETGKMEFVSGGRYIEIEEGDVPPGYLTWDGQLEAQFSEIEMLLEQLYIISETTPAAFGQQKEGLAESGSALRRLMMAPLVKVARIVKSFDPAARKTLKVAAKLEAANGRGTPPLDHIQIEWQDGLPGDPKEDAEAEQIRTGSKPTSSQVSAIQRLDGGTREEAEAEVERINSEGQSQSSMLLAQTETEMAIAAKHAPPGETPEGSGPPSRAGKEPQPSRSSS